ncbi:MAG: hypothetical protein OXH75_29220 [Acidobacteria bacterium]|nr:hypothetical protein [Acidobacteriota bacterium]
MAMMAQAAVERRFLDPAAIQLKYRLARRHHPRPVLISAQIYGVGTTGATLTVVTPPRPRFPRWPMQLLLRCAERIGWDVARPHLEPVIDGLKELLERGWELFRRRCDARV